jgi:hypothetical protein
MRKHGAAYYAYYDIGNRVWPAMLRCNEVTTALDLWPCLAVVVMV